MRTESTKLLGIIIDEGQDWQAHFKSLKSSLNSRLFIIRRIARQIPKTKIINIVHSLWVSKLRYGLQLCTKVFLPEDERKAASLTSLQLTQNRLLRALNNTRIKDKVSIKSMLAKFNLLSVNQLAAQIKLLEVWKSINVEGNPTEMEPYHPNRTESNLSLRQKPNRVFNDSAKFLVSGMSFNVDAARLWNRAPLNVKQAESLYMAKKHILMHVKSFPI